MKFKGAPNPTSINPLERLASWSCAMVEEIISLGKRKIITNCKRYLICFFVPFFEETVTEIFQFEHIFFKLKEPYALENVPENHLFWVCTCWSLCHGQMFSASIRSRYPSHVTEQSTCHLVVNPSGNVKFFKGKMERGKIDSVFGTRRWFCLLTVGKSTINGPGELILGGDSLSSILWGYIKNQYITWLWKRPP